MNFKHIVSTLVCTGLLILMVYSTGFAQDAIKGKIGLGSWLTSVDYKDVKVVSNTDGKVLFQDGFSNPAALKNWVVFKGKWAIQGGLLRQSSDEDDDCRVTVGDASWTDYTLTLKARKTGGKEGFLIDFGYQDTNNYYHLNIAGWGNTQTVIEKTANGTHHIFLGDPIPQSVEEGDWYDIKVVVSGMKVQCFMNDKKIIDTVDDGKDGAQ